MNGFVCCKRILEFNKNAIVIMITGLTVAEELKYYAHDDQYYINAGYSEVEIMVKNSLKNGLRKIITKPIGLELLLEFSNEYCYPHTHYKKRHAHTRKNRTNEI